MNRTSKIVLAFTAAASLASAAAVGFAQDAPQRGGRQGQFTQEQGARPMPTPQMRAERMRQRLAITPAQEPAFQAFLATTSPEGRGPGARADMQGLTTPQRLDRQLAEMQQRVAATKRFYAQLSPEQRQTFDAMPQGRGGRGGPGGREGRGGGRRGPGGPQGHGFGPPAPPVQQ